MNECDKKLKKLEGYRHPTLGKGHFLCGSCFDEISASVEAWKGFVLSNSFNNHIDYKVKKSSSKLRKLLNTNKLDN